MRNGKDDLTSQYILLANAGDSKFLSPMTEYIDSLNSTPEGKAKYQEMTRNAVLGGKMDDLPRKDGSYYVVKSRSTNTCTYYDNSGLERYFYEEPLPEWSWEISDSTKTILGYECIGATALFNGRKWTAWFSPEIPVNAGPWKLEGLPGLILEAIAEGGQYRFVATGLQQTDKIITPVYLADEYEKTDRIKFLRARRSFLDNPLGKSTHSLPVRECLSAKYRMKTAVTPQVQSLSLHQSQTSSKPTIIKAILNTTLSQKAIKMKRTKYAILTAIVLSISTALAQPKANIKVSYDWHQYSPKGVQYKTRMMLLSGQEMSKFFEPVGEYVDSLRSTPEGLEALNQIAVAYSRKATSQAVRKKEYIFMLSKISTMTY